MYIYEEEKMATEMFNGHNKIYKEQDKCWNSIRHETRITNENFAQRSDVSKTENKNKQSNDVMN